MHKIFYQMELSHISDSEKCIIFLGDSFTWGQGLYLPNWAETRNDVMEHYYRIKKTESHLQWNEQKPFFRKQDFILKNDISFTNIVAKKLNRNCYKVVKNGENTTKNLLILKSFANKNFPYKDVIIVFQFSSIGREELEMENFDYQLILNEDRTIKDIFSDKVNLLFDKVNNELIRLQKEFGWKFYYLDWLGDFYRFSTEKFIEIGQKKLYKFDTLCYNYPIKIAYRDKIFYDYHLNEEANLLLANSIINFIQKDLENS